MDADDDDDANDDDVALEGVLTFSGVVAIGRPIGFDFGIVAFVTDNNWFARAATTEAGFDINWLARSVTTPSRSDNTSRPCSTRCHSDFNREGDGCCCCC
jgi:hypothetical protein